MRKKFKYKVFIKIRPMTALLFHVDRRTDMRKLIIAFRNFTKEPKKAYVSQELGFNPKRHWRVKALILSHNSVGVRLQYRATSLRRRDGQWLCNSVATAWAHWGESSRWMKQLLRPAEGGSTGGGGRCVMTSHMGCLECTGPRREHNRAHEIRSFYYFAIPTRIKVILENVFSYDKFWTRL